MDTGPDIYMRDDQIRSCVPSNMETPLQENVKQSGDELSYYDQHSFAQFDISEYPYVTVRYNGGPESDEEMQDYLDKFEALLIGAVELSKNDESQKIKFIFEIQSVSFLKVMKYIGKKVAFVGMIKETGLVESISATAIIISSDIGRKVVQSILNTVTLQKPHKTFNIHEPVKKWFDEVTRKQTSN